MRAYFWGNMYLSSIQQGIQSLHCVSEMFCKYPSAERGFDTDMHSDLYNWASDYKTVVVLNAGEMSSLTKVKFMMDCDENPYAWAEWHESMEAVNGALTSVGIILPEKVYKGAREIKKNWRDKRLADKMGFSEFEKEVIELINTTYMAR